MGKASKWIRNFLIGKKDDKKKNDYSPHSTDYQLAKIGSTPGTPKVKRRWSFGKSAAKGVSNKFSRSLDSIEPSKLPVQVPTEPSGVRRNHAKALVVIRGHIENDSATKIQAAFRSYLAKKALHALRGLVKLQALVRGHIVRKRTASTLMRMHALMSIQVRARVQRVQMAEEADLVVRSQLHNDISEDYRRKVSLHTNESRLVSKSSSDYLNRAQIEALCSGRLSISKRHHYEECGFSTAENSPRSYSAMSRRSPTMASSPLQQPNYPDFMSYGYPNYMTNTKSSKAKVRSQSEPRQRPKQKKKQTQLADGMYDREDYQLIKRSSSQCQFDIEENHDSWFLKLYRTKKSSKNQFSSVNTNATQSKNYFEPFSGYESNFNLF